MSLWSKKKRSFYADVFLTVFALALLSACAKPIGSPWHEVSSGTAPQAADYLPQQTTLPSGDFGEREASDRMITNSDVGATFASSSPPGYPQPMEKFLPEHVFNDDGTSNDNAQIASTVYTPTPEQKAETFEAAEDFVDPVEDWLIQENTSLKQILSDWSDRAGWRMVWKSERDFKIEAGAMLRGRYIDVSSAIIRNMARARPAPIATFFKGNRVLLIETLEDENAY